MAMVSPYRSLPVSKRVELVLLQRRLHLVVENRFTFRHVLGEQECDVLVG